MRITIQLVADVLELRCAACRKLLDSLPNQRNAYFRAADFLDHLCEAPMHKAAFAERVNPRIGQ